MDRVLTGAGLRDVRVADVAAAAGRDRPLLILVAARWQEPVAVQVQRLLALVGLLSHLVVED